MPLDLHYEIGRGKSGTHLLLPPGVEHTDRDIGCRYGRRGTDRNGSRAGKTRI